MTQPSISLPIALRKSPDQASPDLLRELLRMFLEKLMGNETGSFCGADYGERADDHINSARSPMPSPAPPHQPRPCLKGPSFGGLPSSSTDPDTA